MIKPLEGEDAHRYSSFPSDKQPFISEFNITGYSTIQYGEVDPKTELNVPTYQAGNLCITAENYYLKSSKYINIGWVIRGCDSRRERSKGIIADHYYNTKKGEELPKCLEFIDYLWITYDGRRKTKIYVDTVCVTGQAGSKAGEPSVTTEVVTTEPEAPTTQEHVETTKDTEAPVAPFTTTEAPTTQEHVETTLKPCEPCRDVLEGDLAGYYELQSEDDPRCDDGCSYTNQHSQEEFCFRPGGFRTKLECHDPQ